MIPYRKRQILTVVTIISLVLFIIQDFISDNYVIIERMSPPVQDHRSISPRRTTLVDGFSPSSTFFNVDQRFGYCFNSEPRRLVLRSGTPRGVS